MKEQKVLAVDLLTLYLGVEHYDGYEEDGNLYECKSIELYMKKGCISLGEKTRTHLINAITGDEILIDEYGDCLKYEPGAREDIYDVTNLHSFKEAVSLMIEAVKPIQDDIVQGHESVETFEYIRDFIKQAEQEGNPAYMEYQMFSELLNGIENIYLLSYGNPYTDETKEDCLKAFLKENKKCTKIYKI